MRDYVRPSGPGSRLFLSIRFPHDVGKTRLVLLFMVKSTCLHSTPLNLEVVVCCCGYASYRADFEMECIHNLVSSCITILLGLVVQSLPTIAMVSRPHRAVDPTSTTTRTFDDCRLGVIHIVYHQCLQLCHVGPSLSFSKRLPSELIWLILHIKHRIAQIRGVKVYRRRWLLCLICSHHLLSSPSL